MRDIRERDERWLPENHEQQNGTSGSDSWARSHNEAIKWRNAEVEVYSDSTYVVKALNEGWLDAWIRRNWKKVKNQDLWMRFLNVYKKHNVTFHWLKGHAGHPENERCDALAVAAGAGAVAAGVQLPADEGYLAQAGEEGNMLDFS